MKVTKLNFYEEYDKIVALINESQFVSFDCEMTGINVEGDEYRHKREDNADERYLKMKHIASRFSLIQFGLCCYVLDKNDNKLKAYPFVFYLFPENSNKDIIMSISAIDFLKKNNMDFQEWIMNGITFVNKESESWWLEKLGLVEKEQEQEKAEENATEIVLTAEKDIQFFDRNVINLKKMIEDPNATEYTFEFCNAFMRKFLYQYMEKTYPTLTLTKTSDNKFQVLKLSQAELTERKQKQLRDKLGFRQIFKCLKGKPIVGHNCFYDLLFVMNYLEGPLPDDLTTFKRNFNDIFPVVFDTKYMAVIGLFGTTYSDSVLGDLYNQIVAKHAGTNLIIEQGDNVNQQVQLHDAGYDAFVTGSIFWALINENSNQSNNALEDAKLKCGNIVFNMQSLYYFDTDPQRPNGKCRINEGFFYLGGFTKKVLTSDITDLFKQADSTIQELVWINSESTFVAIKSEILDVDVLRSKVTLPEGWILLSLAEYEQKKIDGESNEKVEGVEVESPLKKQKCSII